MDCLEDRVQVSAQQLRAGNQGGDLLLFDDFPVDEIFDVRMIEIEHDHLGGTAGGATRLDCAG